MGCYSLVHLSTRYHKRNQGRLYIQVLFFGFVDVVFGNLILLPDGWAFIAIISKYLLQFYRVPSIKLFWNNPTCSHLSNFDKFCSIEMKHRRDTLVYDCVVYQIKLLDLSFFLNFPSITEQVKTCYIFFKFFILTI